MRKVLVALIAIVTLALAGVLIAAPKETNNGHQASAVRASTFSASLNEHTICRSRAIRLTSSILHCLVFDKQRGFHHEFNNIY